MQELTILPYRYHASIKIEKTTPSNLHPMFNLRSLSTHRPHKKNNSILSTAESYHIFPVDLPKLNQDLSHQQKHIPWSPSSLHKQMHNLLFQHVGRNACYTYAQKKSHITLSEVALKKILNTIHA